MSVDIVTGKKEKGKELPKASIDQSLAAFFEPETREIKCEKCEDGTHVTQTMKILKRWVHLLFLKG